MSRDQEQDLAPLRDRDQLVEYFREGAKPPERRGIGTEHEKLVYVGPELRRIRFDGPGGIEDIFGRLIERYGYEPQHDAGRVVALVRGGEAISLEPGGQLELSGAVTKTIFETADEFDRHIAELADVCGPEYRAVSFGMEPWLDLDDVEWVPKSRYKIMRRYLATRGDLAHWMMKQTCTIQANMDYTSEADGVDLVRSATLVSPLVNALFANSPMRAGESTGYRSYRGHIWTRTDPDRCGVPDFFYGDWGFEEWVEWVLDVPLFFIRRGSEYIDLSGRSFREFMNEGLDGYEATMGDFELHLSTVFPEVRMKKFVEVRSADGGSRAHVLALPALWKGLMYDAEARRSAAALFDGANVENHPPFFDIVAREGLQARWNGVSVGELSGELLRIAGDGLDRIADSSGHDSERGFLAPLVATVESGTTLADEIDAAASDRFGLVEARDLFSAAR